MSAQGSQDFEWTESDAGGQAHRVVRSIAIKHVDEMRKSRPERLTRDVHLVR